jgi:signal peptidase II
MTRTRSRAASQTLLGVLLVSCVGCDQATKRLAIEVLRDRPAQSFLGDTVRLQYAENPGAFLGLGGSLPKTLRHASITGLNLVLVVGTAAVLIARWRMPRVQFVRWRCCWQVALVT